ncbi:uncharacterized protein MELLADRAFT_84288 [Melampsora larici-populina 98AG31]|uniref:Uncharacterized protein n=1 Tax=Melampsora larici-populina (strain 98AG31 / pathotype 3-4-7) TaxID=747676 RepID=F4RF65_MELLP|nr:uncharacterized protein MELLADRAFT_84288 [Melampsora larici-populina 98AG31]EGG08989.1 hypothetical protein MELLADRAFT_84288 [Melampsora larici-populina 98AG31]
MSEPCTGHGLHLSGIFAVEEQEQNYKVEFRTFSTNIICGGDNTDKEVQYEIRATGFSNKELMLLPKHVYFLRGSFFPTNTKETYDDELFFEGSDRALIGTVETFSESVADKTGLTGIGRVLEVDFYVEDHMQYLKCNSNEPDKITLYAIVEHCDFHPETKEPTSMPVEYRIPPFKHLGGLPQIVKPGRECQFHGHVKDFNEETNRYIVIVNKVAPTSSHLESAGRKKAVKVGSQAPNSRPKPIKFTSRAANTPFKSPITASGSGSSTPFGLSDHTPPSVSSGVEKSNPAEPTSQPPKKRARSQPKRKATKVIAPGSEEL